MPCRAACRRRWRKMHRRCCDIESVKVHFPIRRGVLRRVVSVVRAVDGVSLTVREGETVGLVGESGSGTGGGAGVAGADFGACGRIVSVLTRLCAPATLAEQRERHHRR